MLDHPVASFSGPVRTDTPVHGVYSVGKHNVNKMPSYCCQLSFLDNYFGLHVSTHVSKVGNFNRKDLDMVDGESKGNAVSALTTTPAVNK